MEEVAAVECQRSEGCGPCLTHTLASLKSKMCSVFERPVACLMDLSLLLLIAAACCLWLLRSSAVAEGAVMDATAAPDAAEVPEVDPAQPATTLQIRLHDGRRVRAQLNMHHTVRHIQAIIARFVFCVVFREGEFRRKNSVGLAF